MYAHKRKLYPSYPLAKKMRRTATFGDLVTLGRQVTKKKSREAGHEVMHKTMHWKPYKFIGDSCVPPIYICKMVYAEPKFQASQAAGTTYLMYVFRGNDIYDPYNGAGDYFALGLTELAALYESYRVIGSKFTVKASFVSATNSEAIDVTVQPEHDTGTATTQQAIRALPHAVRCTLHNDGMDHILTCYQSTKQVFAVKSPEYGMSSGTGGSPTVPWYWNMWVHTGVTTWIANIEVTIEYYTMFYNLKALSPAGL